MGTEHTEHKANTRIRNSPDLKAFCEKKHTHKNVIKWCLFFYSVRSPPNSWNQMLEPCSRQKLNEVDALASKFNLCLQNENCHLTKPWNRHPRRPRAAGYITEPTRTFWQEERAVWRHKRGTFVERSNIQTWFFFYTFPTFSTIFGKSMTAVQTE